MGIMIGLMIHADVQEASQTTPLRRSYGVTDGEWPRAVVGKLDTT